MDKIEQKIDMDNKKKPQLSLVAVSMQKSLANILCAIRILALCGFLLVTRKLLLHHKYGF